MDWKTLDEMDLMGKRVLTRVDINVPTKNGIVSDTTRIDRIVPTVQHILQAGGTPILIAHFGRPKGKQVPDMSLSVTLPALEAALGMPVKFTTLAAARETITFAKNQVVLIENIRFEPGEEQNDSALAEQLAELGDIYCNDAFSVAHRAHASTEALARLRPACAGRLLAEELGALHAALSTPQRPVVAVVGGAKVSSKLDLLSNLVGQVDHLVIGGGMANTFLAALGNEVGKSLCEHDLADTARDILAAAEKLGCEIILPSDVVVARSFAAHVDYETVGADACPSDAMILDAGDETVARIGACFAQAHTVIWNGPLGAFELEPFDRATNAAAQAAATLTKLGRLISVAGGGDTVAALNHAGAARDFTYISTAGGAFLEWMEGKDLPGVAALIT
ncbi:MAG: phosphoglycerate kinase [Planktomarina sp.]|jgi:phosphoglycerate kinase|nr:phosphoglycerate kinase [Planktomarina sp.]MDT2057380.1 phosphoglycerate kinase [Planktomarina sp.]|tara:strand:- start:42 stop:1220 length:1179 start_codon:yes stop_codon:yes gene_type:complete